MKNKKDNIIKRWYKLCEPNKKVWFGQIITYTIYTLCLFLMTIFAARVINSMYHQNWTKAFIYLGMELLTIVIRNIAMHFEYLLYGKQHIAIRNNMSKKIYNKILILDDKKEKEFTQEKIMRIASDSLANAAEFPDAVASFFGYSIQVVVTLVTVYYANWLAGLIITVLGLVNFYAYYKFNKKLGRIMLNRNETKDEMYKSYSKVMRGKLVINEYENSQKYEEEILETTRKSSVAYADYYNVVSWKNNLYYAAWNIVVYAVAALMLFFVSKGNLDISIYLIIVPYLTTCTDKLNTLFDKTSALENMRVDVDRVNLILDLDEKQLVKYGELNDASAGYNLGLIGVSCKGEDDAGDLIDADISFKMNSINVIKGERGCGKRNVFNCLRRTQKPDKGKILLDNLNLYDFNKKTFKNHVDYCASNPVFIKGSIKENLLVATTNFEKAQEVCRRLQIDSIIKKYSNGYNTNIEDIKSQGVLFLLGLARALLSNCDILMVYELPPNVPDGFRRKIVTYLKKYEIKKTIIIFTHSNDFDEFASMLYTINNGRAKMVAVKSNKGNSRKKNSL